MGERLQSQKSYICPFFDCKANFNKSWKLEAHLCKHTGLKPFSCEDCDKSFCTRYQLTRHQLNHSGDKPHKCQAEGCSEAFVTHASMKNHVARIHQQQDKCYKCDHEDCGKVFNKRNQLNAHKREHTQLLPFHCTFNGCTREFSTPRDLKRHGKVHEGYPCEEDGCPFRGNGWTEYQTHRKEHRIKLKCSDCQKLFFNASFLHMHQLHVHTGEKRVFPCPKEGCGTTFTQRFNLESHILGDHEGKMPFSCAYAGCDKRFAMKESLWRHGVTHDPAKRKLQKPHPKKKRPWRKKSSLSETRSTEAEPSSLSETRSTEAEPSSLSETRSTEAEPSSLSETRSTEAETSSLAARLHSTSLRDATNP